MSKIKIVTDTTCDLPNDWLKRYNITRIPVNIQFGLETFQEGFTIDPGTFYKRINSEGLLPTTSQPALGEFSAVYNDLAANNSQILSIHITSKLSGTWQAATLVAKQLQNKVDITVLDSWTGSVGLGLMVREAAQLVETGLSTVEIITRLKNRRSQINIFILLKDLRYARMSGRVGRLSETMASLLNVKPIVGVEKGALIPVDRIRGQKKGVERMLSLAAQKVGDSPIHIGVAHAIDQPQAEHLLAQIKERFNCRDTFISDLALSIAVHFGPGTIGFATYPAR